MRMTVDKIPTDLNSIIRFRHRSSGVRLFMCNYLTGSARFVDQLL